MRERPSITYGSILSGAERALLQEATTKDYERAFACGDEPNTTICLPNKEKIDILSYSQSQCSFVSLHPDARTDEGTQKINSYLFSDLRDFTLKVDTQEERNIDFVPCDEAEVMQRSRIETFMRLYDQLTPEMAQCVSMVDFRETSRDIAGFARTRKIRPHWR